MAGRQQRKYYIVSMAEQQGFPLNVNTGVFVRRASFPIHKHDFTELVVVLRGTCVHVVEGRAYPISAGEVFVVQGNMTHGFREMEDFELVNVMYSPSLLGSVREYLRRIPGYHAMFVLEPSCRRRRRFDCRLRLDAKSLGEVGDLLDAMRKELSEKAAGYEAVLTAQLIRLVAYLSRRYARVKAPAGQALVRMGQIITHLENHCTEAVSLHDLAARSNMSVNSFLRAFKEATGTSPIHYQHSLQINRARQFLRRTDLTISEAAWAAGFEDSNYFARQFRRYAGCTPSQYRRQSALSSIG